MRLSEQLKVIATTDRIRIIQGEHGNREPEFDPDADRSDSDILDEITGQMKLF